MTLSLKHSMKTPHGHSPQKKRSSNAAWIAGLRTILILTAYALFCVAPIGFLHHHESQIYLSAY